MKLCAWLVAAAVSPLWAQGMNQGERDYALSQLHATRKVFLDSIAGLSEAQWKYKPAPERWSVGEIGEHLVTTEDMLMGLIRKLLAEPAAQGRTVERGPDTKTYAAWSDRSTKAEAPPMLRPAGKWPTPGAVAREFAARRDRTLEFARTTQEDLRSHVGKMGPGEQDAYQLLIGIAAHTERHVNQINEVKAAPGFPK